MVKIITFHVGKNDVKLRGDWTHDLMKEKKIISQVGLELGTSWFQEQNTTTEPRRLITWNALNNLSNAYRFDSVLSNFSQFAPLCATLDLYDINLDLFPLLFC